MSAAVHAKAGLPYLIKDVNRLLPLTIGLGIVLSVPLVRLGRRLITFWADASYSLLLGFGAWTIVSGYRRVIPGYGEMTLQSSGELVQTV